MKLKKLELFGFKSFPDRTEILFHDGVTAVVGPNGCGKSNVIDALRWVMGETSAKGLRGDSMEDVIFSGSQDRKALNLAEVTLTLTEVEGSLPEKFGSFHEVAVTRRLHRAGDSEYLINKVPCRLKDITELFMDTGVGRRAYSVVEQGRIDAILDARPRDRRVLIEEAAGITKYRSRKDETLRKMDHVRQNLQRLEDVIGEVRREMNALKRQASRAEAFKRLRDERRRLEHHRLVAEWLALEERYRAAHGGLEALRNDHLAARTGVDRAAAGLEEERVRLLDEERQAEARQKGVYHLRTEISRRESRLEFLRREVETLSARADALQREAVELAGRGKDLSGERETVAEELAQVEARIRDRRAGLAARERELSEAETGQREADRAVEADKRAVLDVLGELTRVGHGLDHAARQEADAARRLAGMDRQEREVEARAGELEAEISRRAEELVAARAVADEAVRRRRDLDGALEKARAHRTGIQGRVETARKALHTDASRLRGLEQIKASLEWYGSGVRSVLRQAEASGANGVRGVVADVLAAAPEYESALDAALGERLQYVIVESPDRGLEAVQHLKTHRAGRSSFAPVQLRTAGQPVMPAADVPGARGPLLELVAVSPGYEAVAEGLLGDVFVVENLESALDLWRQNGIRATLVTLDGETVTPEGVISGGLGRDEGAGLLRKNREIRELKAAVRRHERALAEAEADLVRAEAGLADLAARADAARDEVHRAELAAVHLARDLDQLRERSERLSERRQALAVEREALDATVIQMREERLALEAERERLLAEQRAAEARLEEGQRAAEAARNAVERARAAVTQHRVDDAADRQRRAGLRERLQTLEASARAVVDRLERLEAEASEARTARTGRQDEVRRLEAETEVLRAELKRDEAAFAARSGQLDELRGSLGARERAVAEARKRASGLQERVHAAELAVRELELQREAVAGRYRERMGGDLAERAEKDGVPEGFDPGENAERIAAIDEKLDRFGEINLLAIEEYDQRRERYAFLEAQKTDLEESLASLQRAIQRINRVSRQRFGETFGRVSRTFREVYPKLFRGGEAELVLTDPEDLLETGIDIVARPPGKRPQHISLLSGGEKALTAVALIFSIFLVKPSPFCVLDEVDAPLDEANIGRFSELVRELASSSQFLIVTHNKSTMESADHLYGVTMSSPGVSKVVSVRLAPEPSPARAA